MRFPVTGWAKNDEVFYEGGPYTHSQGNRVMSVEHCRVGTCVSAGFAGVSPIVPLGIQSFRFTL